MSVIGGSAVVGGSGYQITNSLRFRSAATAYLSRTPGSTTNRTTWTFTTWVKRCITSAQALLSAGDGTGNNHTSLRLNNASDQLLFGQVTGGVVVANRQTSMVLRDPSAWYHVVYVWDTSNATAGDRMRIYVNGTRVTSFAASTDPALNQTSFVNTTALVHNIGNSSYTSELLDGYLAETRLIDGQALDPSNFGQTDINGVWVPKAYSGSYGTNGFYLKFNNGSSVANLGLDSSGNGNTWTVNNVSLTAGATYDWMADTPTNNYATLNPISNLNVVGTNSTASEANLKATAASGASNGSTFPSTLAVSSGKWYAEFTIGNVTATQNLGAGVVAVPTSSSYSTAIEGRVGIYSTTSSAIVKNGTIVQAATAGWANNDVCGVAFDADNLTIQFYKNNVAYGTQVTGLTAATYVFLFYTSADATNTTFGYANFGQRPFSYTPPTGFQALCTANLPSVTITNPKKYFDAVTQLGSAVSTGAALLAQFTNFTADFAWGKDRTASNNNQLVDTLRGNTAILQSNNFAAETTYAAPTAGDNCVAWGWKAGGAGVSNTAGSITSTVSANTTSGFSVVTYTGVAGGVAKTFGHGLGVAPDMVIIKDRSAGVTGTDFWVVYHAYQNASPASGFLALNSINAFTTSSSYWNNTAPSSTVVTVGGTAANVSNESGIGYVAYCFRSVPGFSKFGSFAGNSSADGPFLYCGFRPRYVLVKGATNISEWYVWDAARNPYNVANLTLNPNQSVAEYSAGSLLLDLNANGFKVRDAVGSWNLSGQTYIFAAFAELPTGVTNVSPSPAR